MIARPKSRISRLGWVILMLIGIVLIVLLYSVKTRALEARAQLRSLEHLKKQEQAAVQMLKAEIAHLQSPKRLSGMASDYLQLSPLEAGQILPLDLAVETFPLNAPQNTNGGGRDD